MKFIVDFDFPLEPIQHLWPSGHGREKIGEVLGAAKPEISYFTDSGVGRGAVMADNPGRPARLPTRPNI